MGGILFPSSTHAACTNPAGDKADIIYNGDDNVLQYCDDTNWIIAGQASFETDSNFRKVFVTSTTTTGNFGGLGAADRECNNLAQTAGLTGYFKAWLSRDDTGEDPNSLLTQSTVPYGTVNSIKVADDWSDLIDGVLTNAIIWDENGTAISGDAIVWTNTTTAGGNQGAFDCTDWTSTASSGRVGRAGQLGSLWTHHGTLSCNSSGRFYCFQQDPETISSTTKKVFVTSTTFNGDFVSVATGMGYGGSDGVDAADYICQDFADNATPALTGTFKAWVSHSTSTDPNSTFTQSSDPYVLVDGVKIADDWADLIDGNLNASIMVDEDGNALGGLNRVWTNVTTAGADEGGNDCTNWTSVGGSARYGWTGHLGDLWTDSLTESCNTPKRLYCFEQ